MSALSEQTLSAEPSLRALPLLTLHLTERCNSRCVSCDYWRNGRKDMTLESVQRLLPGLAALGTKVILISGGEPLLHSQWSQIARLLRANGLQLWLVTSGLSLAKHANAAAELFQTITVSLDGIDQKMYAAIRGLNAFDKVCEGIRAAVGAGACVTVRVTVQRANYRALPRLVELAHELGVFQISFLAADVFNAAAFGRSDGFHADIALAAVDLTEFRQTLEAMEQTHAEYFRSGFIAERPQKLRRILTYYSAICGLGAFPPTRCNAPEFSAVMEADGRVKPCFFISGPIEADTVGDLEEALNGEPMKALREAIRVRHRSECVTCVCSMWREPSEHGAADFRPRRLASV